MMIVLARTYVVVTKLWWWWRFWWILYWHTRSLLGQIEERQVPNPSNISAEVNQVAEVKNVSQMSSLVQMFLFDAVTKSALKMDIFFFKHLSWLFINHSTKPQKVKTSCSKANFIRPPIPIITDSSDRTSWWKLGAYVTGNLSHQVHDPVWTYSLQIWHDKHLPRKRKNKVNPEQT